MQFAPPRPDGLRTPLFCWRGSLGVDWNAVFPMKRIYGICLRSILSFALRMWNLFRLLWMLGALGSLLDVTCGKWAAFQVWGRPKKHIQPGGSRDWRKRARFGPNASGANANSANSVKDTPPAMRKTPARELLIFFRLLAKLVSLQRCKPTGRWDSPGWPTRVPMLR